MMSRSLRLLTENSPLGGRRAESPCAPGALGLTLATSNRGLFAVGVCAYTPAPPINASARMPTSFAIVIAKNFISQTTIGQERQSVVPVAGIWCALSTQFGVGCST